MVRLPPCPASLEPQESVPSLVPEINMLWSPQWAARVNQGRTRHSSLSSCWRSEHRPFDWSASHPRGRGQAESTGGEERREGSCSARGAGGLLCPGGLSGLAFSSKRQSDSGWLSTVPHCPLLPSPWATSWRQHLRQALKTKFHSGPL